MFKQFTKKSLIVLAGVAMATLSYASNKNINVDGAIIYPSKFKVDYIRNNQVKGPFHIGKKATKKEIAGWNLDVRYDGKGLYSGKGSVADGEEIYSNKCVKCHGDFGAGGKGYPVLAGGQGTLKNQRIKVDDDSPLKTVGSYWPYASTLLWYVKTGMPQDHPNSLTNDEAYAVAAYILSLNDITVGGKEMDDDFVLNKKNFVKIHLPNEHGFIPEDKDLKHFLNNPKNPYLGKGKRCMKNCAKKIKITHIVGNLTPKIDETRDLPKPKKSASAKKVNNPKGEKIYKTTCIGCHGTGALGAPKFGDSVAWDKVIKKGMKDVYENAINGTGDMPARGGNPSLSDGDVKSAVDYIVQSSK